MYRPEGWENPYFIPQPPEDRSYPVESNEELAFEAGADALLTALREKGIHYNAGVILDPGLIMEIVHSGTLSFIPDEQRK